MTALTDDVDIMNATEAPQDCSEQTKRFLELFNGTTAYQLVAATLMIAVLVAWVRRSTNQKAVLLGFGIESAFSLVNFLAVLYYARQNISCLGFPSPDFWPSVARNIMLILARLGQTVCGIAGGVGNNKSSSMMGLLFTAFCAVYFLVFCGFELGTEKKPIGNFFIVGSQDYKNFVDTVARSVPGAVAGFILAIQRAPANGEAGVEMP